MDDSRLLPHRMAACARTRTLLAFSRHSTRITASYRTARARHAHSLHTNIARLRACAAMCPSLPYAGRRLAATGYVCPSPAPICKRHSYAFRDAAKYNALHVKKLFRDRNVAGRQAFSQTSN